MPYRPEQDEDRKARRRALYQYILDSQRYMTDLNPYFSRSVATLQRVASGSTQTPNKGTDLEVAKFLRISKNTLEDYLSGNISLEILISRTGEDKTKKGDVTVESVIHDVLSLPIPKRLEVLSRIVNLVREKDVVPVPTPKTISLTNEERTRLKKILTQSLAINDFTVDDLHDVSSALLEYIDSAPVEVEFEEKDYLALLPYLYRVQKWVQKKSGLIPMLDIENTYKSLENLISDLQSELFV